MKMQCVGHRGRHLRHLSLMLWTRAHCFKRKRKSVRTAGAGPAGQWFAQDACNLRQWSRLGCLCDPVKPREDRLTGAAGTRTRHSEEQPPAHANTAGGKSGPWATLATPAPHSNPDLTAWMAQRRRPSTAAPPLGGSLACRAAAHPQPGGLSPSTAAHIRA